MSEINIKGMKFWRVLRCSQGEQEIESFPQQRRTTELCAERYGVTIAGTTELSGHSATQGEQVEPLLKLIKTKVSGADFDGLILDSYSRFARTDADESRLYAECRDADLLILTDKEGMMMGQGTWAKRGSATDQNEGYARDLGRNVNRAVSKLISDGLVPPTLSFPWGLDREYYDQSGKATMRVRRLPDGRKAVLDPEPPHALRFHISPEKSRLNIRDSGHSFRFVPGAIELQDIAKTIFRQHYIEGVRFTSLCMDLNRRGILTSKGNSWTEFAIRSVLHNPIWIGISVSTLAKGHHCQRTSNGVSMYAVSKRPGYRKDNRKRKAMQTRVKPVSEWIMREQPKLKTFLDPEIREEFTKQWEQRKSEVGKIPSTPPKNKRRPLPPKSRYFLSNLLVIKGDRVPMIGSDGPTRPDTTYRYYVTRREVSQPVGGRPKERVRAELVEAEVKSALATALKEIDIHTPTIAKYIDEKRREMMGKRDVSPELRSEKGILEKWYRETYSVAGARGAALLASEAERVIKRLDEIDIQLAEAGHARPEFLDCDTDEVIASIRRQFRDIATTLDEGFEAVRDLVSILCPRLEFDPTERVVEIDIALPEWAMSPKSRLVENVGTKDGPASVTFRRTNNDGVLLLKWNCCEDRKLGRKLCLICHRPVAA